MHPLGKQGRVHNWNRIHEKLVQNYQKKIKNKSVCLHVCVRVRILGKQEKEINMMMGNGSLRKMKMLKWNLNEYFT